MGFYDICVSNVLVTNLIIQAAWERYYMIWRLEPICVTSNRVRRIASIVGTNYFAALVTAREHAIEFIYGIKRKTK